jgi:hypothetical protein
MLASSTSTSTSQSSPTSISFKFLVGQRAVGGIIGRAGVAIRETSSKYNVRIRISNEVLNGSTEKSMVVSGKLDEGGDGGVVCV